MRTHLYAFGSICRGEVDQGSDIDLLACISGPTEAMDRNKFSIYTHERLRALWREGNPFAWHLHLESRLLFSADGTDFIAELGPPAAYAKSQEDCEKFRSLFRESFESLASCANSAVFHLSCMFLATRNFATCYSFTRGTPIFSRSSPLLIDPRLPLPDNHFELLARARILSTRGHGAVLSAAEIADAAAYGPVVLEWMQRLVPARVMQ